MYGQHVLITGGNKGIGLETTRMFLHAGYRVSIVARDFSGVKVQDNCEHIVFDLRQTGKIRTLISGMAPVNILVNNAGMMNTVGYDTYPDNLKNDLLKVNLEAPVELMNCVAEGMKVNGGGRIVNVASIAGHIGHPDIWYGISKAGLINATKSYAKELGKYGILINSVAPAIVETEMKNCIPESRQKAFLGNVYSGRFAQPEEVAKVIFWLGTESPEYVNGHCIDINNGAFPR
ncbi:SDR family NAD(P)-dependent oxidoreductase [Saccharicrinis sp. FJH54]|uniref:SDR family NAD(P)-dependent oxidoreductase n=1 Tax=Saccharicrinis sp. FJH54 TaxID=3344665 RepID=UPI0035D4D8BF